MKVEGFVAQFGGIVRRDQRFNVNFHGIGTPTRDVESDETPYWISQRFFEQVLDLVQGRDDVHLTFDDGNVSDVTIGLPALHERGLRATFYPVADRIGRPGSTSAAGLRELVAAGMGIGSHGYRHRPWRKLGAADLNEELIDARQVIGDAAETAITTVACPFGSYDRRSTRLLRGLQYATVFTSDRAVARSSAWLQPRFSLRHTDDIAGLRALLDTAPGRIHGLRAGARMTAKRWR